MFKVYQRSECCTIRHQRIRINPASLIVFDGCHWAGFRKRSASSSSWRQRPRPRRRLRGLPSSRPSKSLRSVRKPGHDPRSRSALCCLCDEVHSNIFIQLCRQRFRPQHTFGLNKRPSRKSFFCFSQSTSELCAQVAGNRGGLLL